MKSALRLVTASLLASSLMVMAPAVAKGWPTGTLDAAACAVLDGYYPDWDILQIQGSKFNGVPTLSGREVPLEMAEPWFDTFCGFIFPVTVDPF